MAIESKKNISNSYNCYKLKFFVLVGVQPLNRTNAVTRGVAESRYAFSSDRIKKNHSLIRRC
ncbi:MAG: hypothetical protein WA919_08445 [Coleofasciculaceae cyanobacterium]